MTNNDKVLMLDVKNMTQAELDWIHELKNLAQAMSGRLQLKKLLEERAA